METIAAFKRSLQISDDKAREIEKNTREQRFFFSLVLSASISYYLFTIWERSHTKGYTTPPDSLVLCIIQSKSFSTAATRYGIENEQVALKEYLAYQQSHGHPELAVGASGFLINPAYSFLGASPDGAVYDPSSAQQPFGFVEIKCPYSHRHASPAEACNTSSFCCEFDTTTGTSGLKRVINTTHKCKGKWPSESDHGVILSYILKKD